MPDFGTAVSDMDVADAVTGDELVPIVQGGDNKRVTAAALLQPASDALTTHELDPDAHADLFTGDQIVTSIIVKDSPTDVRHPDFGGIDQTGSTDATATIQAAIDYITGPADPTANVRSANSPLYIPAGDYKITEPIRIESVVGFHLYGDGKEQTTFKPTGTMDRVLDLKGTSRSSFGGFSIFGNGTEAVDGPAIHCRRNDAARSTNFSTLYNIALTSTLKCVTGIRIGEAGDNTQNDTWKLDDLEVLGSFEAGETTWWQAGIHVGTGAFNNNLDHKGYDLNVGDFRRNFYIDACQLAVFGFECGGAEADFYVTEHTVYLVAVGGRSEASNRMLEQTTSGSSPGHARFEDIDWKGNNIHVDGKVVSWRYGGSLFLKNCRWYVAGTPPGATPRLETITSGNKLDVAVDGCSATSTLKEFLTNVDSTTQVNLRNGFVEMNGSGQTVTHSYGTTQVSGGAATDVVHRNRLKGDTYDRYQLAVSGLTYRGDGTAAPVLAAPTLATFNVTGAVAVGAGVARLPIPFAAVIVGVSATAGTAPVGADLIIDVNVSGISIFTTIANRPKIIDGAHATAAEVTNMDTTTVASGSYLTVDVDQVGSGTAGSDLTVSIRYRAA